MPKVLPCSYPLPILLGGGKRWLGDGRKRGWQRGKKCAGRCAARTFGQGRVKLLVLNIQTNGKAGKEDLSGFDIGADAVEAVAGIDAVPVVGDAGGDTEIPFVGAEGIDATVGGGNVTHRIAGGSGAGEGVFGAAIAAVDAEVPVEAIAHDAAGNQAHALEELEGHLGEGEATGADILEGVNGGLGTSN